jgi:hypothetical protein
MEPTSEREQHVFVVRVWRDDAAGAWRGTIVDVESGQRLSSTDLTDVGDFIRLRLPENEPTSGLEASEPIAPLER